MTPRKSAAEGFDWMRAALTFLFDECDNELVRAAVNDDETLHTIQDQANEGFAASDRLQMPSGDQRDNLWRALIALRLRFVRDEAFQKLERNLQLRANS